MKFNRYNSFRKVALFLVLMLLMPVIAVSKAETNPMSSFSWLIGGKWEMKDGTYHTFEWGLGKRSVKAKTYFKVEDEYVLVSEGLWFWHPGEKLIKGYFTAKNMPFVFMEFTTKFEDRKMINKLKAIAKDGKVSHYSSTWSPIGKDGYSWKLFTGEEGSLKEVMKGDFKRKGE